MDRYSQLLPQFGQQLLDGGQSFRNIVGVSLLFQGFEHRFFRPLVSPGFPGSFQQRRMLFCRKAEDNGVGMFPFGNALFIRPSSGFWFHSEKVVYKT